MTDNLSKKGFVSFVSGGPGPVDLLTLRGLDRIKDAEVILYDALLDPEYLSIFPENVLCLYVGKRSGQHSRSQNEINDLLLNYALAGKRIVRLKGGDATIFGRLGEETKVLRDHQINFEIIPGVSSVTAGISAISATLTLRDVSRQIIILDGHTIATDNRSWVGMENFLGTIVILMGSQKTNIVAEKLLEKGLPGFTPIALIENASNKNFSSSFSTLAEAKSNGMEKKSNGPGILYVGETIRHALEENLHVEKISSLPKS